ncbi:Hpt domain-containing protein [Luteolibacter yonseiensis]|uniref:Hpt domain-containing protein n=1 Tax=Luteolibacter yonseiensis TaxID=1144680 RepID=A0A934R7Z0_9BACT|nr:Hpt domain-containing protein [Luteolibacter yonseiensis]MBK1817967.1 Hpt domain-containing protein [Luteolibacter yonseiensis]
MDSEPTTSSDSLLDVSQLDTFVMLGYDEYSELLGDVRREVPNYFTVIHGAIASGDSKTCSAACHSCRGMLSYFGCVVLNNLLGGLENGPLPDKSQADPIHDELLTTWNNSLNALLGWEKTVPDFAP